MKELKIVPASHDGGCCAPKEKPADAGLCACGYELKPEHPCECATTPGPAAPAAHVCGCQPKAEAAALPRFEAVAPPAGPSLMEFGKIAAGAASVGVATELGTMAAKAAPAESCCGQPASAESCYGQPAPVEYDPPGYRRWPFVAGWLSTPIGRVPRVKTVFERPDRLGAVAVRLGIGRGRYRVSPGVYGVGNPGPASPVLVTANYKLSFDVLRCELCGLDVWLLVLDTHGVNVWCAAGKGTFGTRELVDRIRAVGLEKLVSHRTVVVPQLGAPGVAGHAVRKATGFRVVFGPVRARDVGAFLMAGQKATAAMRRVEATAWERFVAGLVEFSNEKKTMALVVTALFVLAGIGADVFSLDRAFQGARLGFGAYLLGFLAGNLLTSAALPWLPGRSFSLKGAVAGAVVGFGVSFFAPGLAGGLGLWLGAVVAGSWYGMNFTGSSVYTSPSGVEKEMRRAIPLQAVGLVLALVLWRLGLGG